MRETVSYFLQHATQEVCTVWILPSNSLKARIAPLSIRDYHYRRVRLHCRRLSVTHFHSTRVKSDALFSYQLPFNILALLLLSPLSWCVTPRTLHGVNVFLIKLTVRPLRALFKPGNLTEPSTISVLPHSDRHRNL